ncbi:MAG: hypothetical protein QOE83_2205 [Actinomycetota bacterium]|nr:hypothetical protein [Actinomycetota bacterium]
MTSSMERPPDTRRDWSAGELDALRVAAGMLAAAIGRQQAKANLRERES